MPSAAPPANVRNSGQRRSLLLMDMRRLGNSGLTVSVVGLGGNNLGRPGTASETLAGAAGGVNAAIDAGITLFDTADSYGKTVGLSEELLGRALGRRRDEVILATKFGMDVGGTNGRDHGDRKSTRLNSS